MKKEKFLYIILKAAAIFLWYFVAIFFFIVWDINRENLILKEGSIFGEMMVRFPYQWDFELFFAGLFLVWGFYLWRATENTQKDSNFIKFTGWAFLIHAITMIVVGTIRSQDLVHLVTDSIYWFLFAFLILHCASTPQKN